MKLNKWNENIDRHRRIVLGWARKLCSVADRISSVLMKNSVGFMKLNQGAMMSKFTYKGTLPILVANDRRHRINVEGNKIKVKRAIKFKCCTAHIKMQDSKCILSLD